MKKIVTALMILVGITCFAGTPETKKIVKATYNMVPEPPKPSPNGYLYDCCHNIYLGWNLTHTCYSIIVECWGACAGHGWLVDACNDGTITIRGAFLVPDNTGPKKVEFPLTTAVMADKFDATLDPISQIKEYKKIENTIIEIEAPITMETEDGIFVFAAGTYQIIDSKLMVIATQQLP